MSSSEKGKVSRANERIGRDNGEMTPGAKKSCPSTETSRNKAACSAEKTHSPPQSSRANVSTRTQSGYMDADTSDLYRHPDTLSAPRRASQLESDLLGLALNPFEDHHEASSAHSAVYTQPGGCKHHLAILPMHDVGSHGQGFDPMARWLAEGPSEQSAVIRLPDGQLSIHKDCQCIDISNETDLEIDE